MLRLARASLLCAAQCWRLERIATPAQRAIGTG
jgi:hypothetical protein